MMRASGESGRRGLRALVESEQRLRLAQQVARIGSFEYDIQANTSQWSAELEALHGLAPGGYGGRYEDWAALVHPDDLPQVERRLRESLETGTFEAEWRVVWPDGSIHWLAARGQVFKDDAGTPLQMVGVNLDITDRKRAEEELKAAKRTAELAKVAAESASKAKDHFLAVLSHELRTPLTPVVTALAMLQARPDLDAGVRESLEMIRRNVEMEAQLIDDLLDVTRIERGKIELDCTPIELGEVIRRAVEVVKPDLDARRQELCLDLGEAACPLMGDAGRLQQVFWNLLKNAVKFTPHGGRIGVRCRAEAGQAVVEVSDSGAGIEAEALERIFDAFEQGERSVTQHFGGLGLGLTISRALVQLHGGSIAARSEGKGKGATFRVRLPLAVAVKTNSQPAPAPPAWSLRPLRILLVEDHGDTARMLRQLLMLDGHAVDCAGDAGTALELCARNTYDLLISDLGLPDASGVDLLRAIRVRGCCMPGIALSGFAQEDDIRRSREAGFAVHVTKPTSPQRLAEAIVSVL